MLPADSGRRQGKSWCATFSQRSGADSRPLRLQIGRRGGPAERRPANAGQTRVFARHRNVLGAQWIPSKCEQHAGQSLYVPLPISTGFEWSGTAAELETFWRLLVNLAACAPEVETFCKLPGNLPRPDCPGRQMADTPSILSASRTRGHCEEDRDAGRPLVRHFLYVPLPVFAAVKRAGPFLAVKLFEIF